MLYDQSSCFLCGYGLFAWNEYGCLAAVVICYGEYQIIFVSHYSALRSGSGVALEGKGTGAWHSGKKWLSYTTA